MAAMLVAGVSRIDLSHIPNQQREIYKIAVGLYAAAPGTSYFGELNNALEAGLSVGDVY